MFARVKKSGKYQYLQIVENRKEKSKVKQRVISTVCIFRMIPATDSGAKRPPIPIDSGH